MIFDSWMWFLFFPSFGKTITLFISSANIFFLWYFHMESCVTVYMIINFRTIDGVCHIFQNWSFQAAAWWWESPYRLLVMAVILLECLWCYSSSLLYINQCCYVFFFTGDCGVFLFDKLCLYNLLLVCFLCVPFFCLK